MTYVGMCHGRLAARPGRRHRGDHPTRAGWGSPSGSVLLGDERAGDRRARAHVELAEDVLQMALDGLHAEHQLTGDLAVGHALAHEPRDLLLARAELAGGRAATVRREAPPEPAELARGLVAVAGGAARVELGAGALELLDGSVALAHRLQRGARQEPRARGLDAGSGALRRRAGLQRRRTGRGRAAA